MCIRDSNNSLNAGERGPSLLEDFILREKITHFDHERIPERIVHARESGAHGIFELYESQSEFTKEGFLNDTSRKTPVFVRFSTVEGSKGSTDFARDVRGFAVKVYTDEGMFDLVGNNIPVFAIQDAMKFPDFIHSVKPEPDHEMPQAASAHDTFWDFVSFVPETMHMVSWVMSDRGIPKSLRMMEGFGIHTFRPVSYTHLDVYKRQDQARTISYLTKDGKVLGFLSFSDKIKESSKKAIAYLQNQNIEVVMMTGDNKHTAKAVACLLYTSRCV